MILRPDQIKLLGLGLPSTPCNIGGPEVSKSDANSSTTNTTTTNTDNRMVNDHGVGVSGTGNIVNTTDLGAVNAAFDFANAGSENAFKSTQDALGLANNVVSSAAGLQKNAADGLLSGLGTLLTFARSTADNAMTTSENAQKNIAAAYSNVQEISTGQRFLVAGGLLIAGVVAVAAMNKNKH